MIINLVKLPSGNPLPFVNSGLVRFRNAVPAFMHSPCMRAIVSGSQAISEGPPKTLGLFDSSRNTLSGFKGFVQAFATNAIPPFFILAVACNSMKPTLSPDDTVICREVVFRGGLFDPILPGGKIIVFRHPKDNILEIKRVTARQGEISRGGTVPPNHLFVLGDNPSQSIDSRHFGFLPVVNIIGFVEKVIKRP